MHSIITRIVGFHEPVPNRLHKDLLKYPCDERPRGLVANVLYCKIVVNEFEFQSCYYVHFQINTLGEGKNFPYLPSNGFMGAYKSVFRLLGHKLNG